MKSRLLEHLNPIEHKVLEELAKRLEEALSSNLERVTLFGSKARGDFHSDSDVDVFVIVGKRDYKTREIVSSIVSDLMLQYDVFLVTNVRDVSEIEKLQQYKVKFLENLERDGIELWTTQ